MGYRANPGLLCRSFLQHGSLGVGVRAYVVSVRVYFKWKC